MKSARSVNTEAIICRYRESLEKEASADLKVTEVNHFNGRKFVFTVSEVAVILRVSVRTIDRMLKRGEIQYKKSGRRVLIPVSAVEAWLNEKD